MNCYSDELLRSRYIDIGDFWWQNKLSLQVRASNTLIAEYHEKNYFLRNDQ